MKQPLLTLQIRGKPAVQHAKLIELARANSPATTYDLALSETGSQETAKAARWLAVLRRDYGDTAFEAFVLKPTQ